MEKIQNQEESNAICCNFCTKCNNACGVNQQGSQKNQTIQLEITRYGNPVQAENKKEFATKITIADEKEVRFCKSLNFSEAIQAMAKILEKEEEDNWLYAGLLYCAKCENPTVRVLGDADSVKDSTRICIECGRFPQSCVCRCYGDDEIHG